MDGQSCYTVIVLWASSQILRKPWASHHSSQNGWFYFQLNSTQLIILLLQVGPSDLACAQRMANFSGIRYSSTQGWQHGMMCCGAVRLLWECSHTPSKPSAGLGNNGWPCFHLNSPFFFRKLAPQIWHILVLGKVWSLSGRLWHTVMMTWKVLWCYERVWGDYFDTSNKPLASLSSNDWPSFRLLNSPFIIHMVCRLIIFGWGWKAWL